MDPDREPAAIAYKLAEKARALNDCTEKPQAFTGLPDVRNVAEGLHLATSQMPQAVRQLSAGLRLLEEQDAICADDGTDASETVSLALRALLNAEVGLTVARASLREAAGPLSRMSELRVGVIPDRGGAAAP